MSDKSYPFPGREGDACLAESEFVESHPIVYWNLVWFLERANIENHLPDLLCADFQARYRSLDAIPDGEKSGEFFFLSVSSHEYILFVDISMSRE